MMHALGWAGAMAAILVMCLWLGTRKARIRRTEQAWLPVELRHARIEFAERYFYTKRPVRLIAKVDRVYKDERGTLFVTELKRRVKTQAYLSDVVELSAQKLAIERGGRRAVAELGFVVIEHPVTQKRTPIARPATSRTRNHRTRNAIRASRRRRRNARQGECRRPMSFVRLRRSLSTGSAQRYLGTTRDVPRAVSANEYCPQCNCGASRATSASASDCAKPWKAEDHGAKLSWFGPKS